MIEVTREIEYWSGSPEQDLMWQTIAHHAVSLYIAEAQGSSSNNRQTHETVMLAERYIRLNYDKNILLTDLAAYASVSPEHLCRLFSQNLKKSPMTCVWEFRTAQALKLLASTGLSVAGVADRCGFKNSIHLNQRIRVKTGLSPTEYRKRIWATD
jgi:AraC family transcriptional regulator of arabinose operon